ncbi:MAG: iron-only hydrogenase system regulator [Candidatus Cloacimonetes bacterium]|nr:iron-only hydrogenase system regulator [Candidatus Cloacimonadota bacterium]
MDLRRHIVTIIIEDIECAYHPVTELLHDYAGRIQLRLGYPMRDKAVSVIFLVIDLTIAEMGAFSGKLGQMNGIRVKSMLLKVDKESTEE